MDERFASGAELALLQIYRYMFEKGDKSDASQVQKIVGIFHCFRFVKTGQSIRRMCMFC